MVLGASTVVVESCVEASRYTAPTRTNGTVSRKEITNNRSPRLSHTQPTESHTRPNSHEQNSLSHCTLKQTDAANATSPSMT